MKLNPGVLVLEDKDLPEGRAFEGFLFGAQGKSLRDRGYGEVVFNTSLTGYQEILTDPSYYGQMVCMTVPHVGNTGANAEDLESLQPWCAGFIVHEISEEASNWRARESLDSYLQRHGIPGLTGVDTRALTRHLRTQGVVRGVILPATERERAGELLKTLPSFEGRDLIGEVTTREAYRWPISGAAQSTGAAASFAPGLPGERLGRPGPVTDPSSWTASSGRRLRVVAMDFGVKWNLLRSLERMGCDVEVVSAHATSKDILERNPDGIFLSNGPGDPSAAPYAARTVRELVGKKPIFGVCMGHQVLALAMGARTYKLKFGHRGGNQPVLDQDTRKVEISSHNHGYAVDAAALPPEIEITHINLNDRTVEGLRVKGTNAFSVQYHPEACPGPHDSMILFERFVGMMRAAKSG